MSSILEKKIQFAEKIKNEIVEIKEISADTLSEINKFIQPAQPKEPNLWEAANILGLYYNRHTLDELTVKNIRKIISSIREFQGELAFERKDPTTIVLGTSGWRGVIGEDFTVFNIHKVVRAIIKLVQSDLYLKYNGFKSFDEVKTRGVLLTRDNRFMGDVWLDVAKKELTSAGIKVYNAGMCPTGVGSAFVKDKKLAALVNFTPSHNPMEYAGVKFNPADGGGAESDLTSQIENYANALMSDDSFVPQENTNQSLVEEVDGGGFFRDYIEKKSIVFDLPAIRSWLLANKKDLFFVIDFMHGASRGYVQALLGKEVWESLKKAGALLTRHEDEDYSFHGMRPEPSAANQKPLLEILKKNSRKFTLAVSLDPDADRIRYTDEHLDMDMNLFSAVAYSGLLERNIKGNVVSSVPSSGLVGKIARLNGYQFIETPVGFKNFRSAFGSGDCVMGFEESDGISFIGHTLEKCALSGLLAAFTSLAQTNKNLSVQYEEIRKKYGYFYPGRAGVDVKGVSVEAWQAYKKAVVKVLETKMYNVGDIINIDGQNKKIVKVNTIDGLKIILEDDSWILLRPSGTEPKFRYYFEVVSDKPIDDPAKQLNLYNDTASRILEKARSMVA